MLSIDDLDLRGKRVLIRVDFNVPIDADGHILDDTRIRASLPTIQKVIQSKGIAILISHLGRPKGKMAEYSLKPCAKRLSELLHQDVLMAPDTIGEDVKALISSMKPGDVCLLENVRFYPAEEHPELDPSFAKKLAELGDIYINDAFGSAHRAHSSTTLIASSFPGKKAPGYLLEKELLFLGKTFLKPEHPFYAIIGGAKVSTKIAVLQSLLSKVDALFIGGAMAYTFFKAQGKTIGDSKFEEEMVPIAKALLDTCREKNIPLYLPVDTVVTTHFDNQSPFKTVEGNIPDGYQGMDIGKKTIADWEKKLKGAKTIFWNGPVGVFEFSHFAKGTLSIAKTVASLKDVTTIAGGGETVAAIQQANLSGFFSHISTGGGATLEYIEHGTLPGVDALV